MIVDQETITSSSFNIEKVFADRSILNAKAEIFLTYLLTRNLNMNRTFVYREAAELYKDATLIHEKLNVTFIGELGIDLDGVTREFWYMYKKLIVVVKADRILKLIQHIY